MKTKIKKILLVCLLTFFVSSLVIGSANARGGTFVVSPMQEVREVLELNPPTKVSGSIKVQNGTIDFYVTNPSKEVVLCRNQTQYIIFNFTASENGNYTMHFFNPSSSANSMVILDFSIHFIVVLQENLNLGFSTGVAHVSSPPLLPPVDLPDLPDLEGKDVYMRYHNFREADKILNLIRSILKYSPPASPARIFSLSLLLLLCYGFTRIRPIVSFNSNLHES